MLVVKMYQVSGTQARKLKHLLVCLFCTKMFFFSHWLKKKCYHSLSPPVLFYLNGYSGFIMGFSTHILLSAAGPSPSGFSSSMQLGSHFSSLRILPVATHWLRFAWPSYHSFNTSLLLSTFHTCLKSLCYHWPYYPFQFTSLCLDSCGVFNL